MELKDLNVESLTAEELQAFNGGAANLAAYDTATGIMCGAAASGFFFGGVGGVFTGTAFGPACGLMVGIRMFAL